MKHAALLCLALLCVLGAAGRPEERPPAPSPAADTSLYRVSASSLRSTIENGERIVYLERGVRIVHETTTITSLSGKNYPARRYTVLYDSVRVVDGTAVMQSDVGEYFGATNTIVLNGHVRFSDRGWKARCDRVRYNRGTRIAVLTGNLSVADSTRTMYADTVVYDRDREVADATGRVVLIDDAENYSLAGAHIRFDRRAKSAIADVKPVLTFDLSSAEKGTVVSRIMHFDVDRKIGIAEGDVQMAKGDTRASCDSAVIYDRDGRAELFGRPRATNGRSTMSGTRMTLWYDRDEVTRVVLPESGRLTESPKPGSPWREDSWIEGDSISVHLSNEQVDSVHIVKSAKAMYYPIEGEAGKVSNDYSTGDRMFFLFKDKELSYIRITGASTGLYKYVNLGRGETIDSLAATIDSSLTYKNFERANERVRYSADKIEYFAATENVVLRGHAVLSYQQSSLDAERIDFNSRLNLLEATGKPVLEEKEQRMYGAEMGYDLDKAAGVIVDGSTKYGEGYYEGQDIFKVGEDVLKVYRSTYTTCDLAKPHYSFRSDRMKVYIDDKIVSGPIWLYVGKIPVFYLPFMVNSLHHARSSGFLKPNVNFGLSSREGRFIQGFGYYWATNDYTDFLLTGDFNERRSLRLHLMNQYAVRYLLHGNVRLDFVRAKTTRTAPYQNEWTIESDHSQTFSPSASFTSGLRFVSSDNAQAAVNEAQDITRFIDRRIYSSASYRKSWGGTNLSLSGSRDQKLNVTSPTDSRISTTFPSFSLVFPQRSLWFGERHPSGARSLWERGLGSILFTPKLSATRQSFESIARKYSTVATGYSLGLGRQAHIGFIGLNPNVGFAWSYAKLLDYTINPGYDTLFTARDRPRETNEVSMSLGTSMSTKVYGTFRPRIGPLAAIRHTITPSVQYGFTPKLTASQRESQSVSWSLDNSIDLKIKRGDEEVKVNDVFAWYLSGTYNPYVNVKFNPKPGAAQAFSDISSTSRLRLGSIMSFNLNNRYSPYRGRVLSTDFSLDMSLHGTLTYPATWTAPQRERIRAAVEGEAEQHEAPSGEPYEQGGARGAGAWSFGLGYSLSESGIGAFRSTNSNVRYNGTAQLTKGWKLTFSGYYNVDARDFTQQLYKIDRDLHCWQASFVHERTGTEWRYYFQISIKAHPEIKYERGTQAAGSSLGSYVSSF
jgi:lipopolysaccharide assembly outer membrane protein LptD (OstA)